MWKPGILLPPLHNSLIGTRDCTCCSTPPPEGCLICEPPNVPQGQPVPQQWMITISGWIPVPGNPLFDCLNCDNFNGTWFLDFESSFNDPDSMFAACTWSIDFDPIVSALPCSCGTDPLKMPHMDRISLGIQFDNFSFDGSYRYSYNTSQSVNNEFIHNPVSDKLIQEIADFDCNYSGFIVNDQVNFVDYRCSGFVNPTECATYGTFTNHAVSIAPVP